MREFYDKRRKCDLHDEFPPTESSEGATAPFGPETFRKASGPLTAALTNSVRIQSDGGRQTIAC
jgi:hypothetical protein